MPLCHVLTLTLSQKSLVWMGQESRMDWDLSLTLDL